MHRPVLTARHGVLPGAVKGVDDPHPVGLQPGQVVVGLLGEHRVAGALLPQSAQQQRVGTDVSGITERRREIVADLLAHHQQQPPGLLGQIGGQLGIGANHPVSIADAATGPVGAARR